MIQLVGILEEWNQQIWCVSSDLVSVQTFCRLGGVDQYLLVAFEPLSERNYWVLPKADVVNIITVSPSDTWATVITKLNAVSSTVLSGLSVIRPIPKQMRTTRSGNTIPIQYINKASYAPRIYSLESIPNLVISHGKYHYTWMEDNVEQSKILVLPDGDYIQGVTNDLVVEPNDHMLLDFTTTIAIVNGIVMPTLKDDNDRLWILDGMKALESSSHHSRGILLVDLGPLGTVTKFTTDQFNTSVSPGFIQLPSGTDLTQGYVLFIFHGKIFFKHELDIRSTRYFTLRQGLPVGTAVTHSKRCLAFESQNSPLWSMSMSGTNSFRTYIKTTPTSLWFGENCVIQLTGKSVYLSIIDAISKIGALQWVFPKNSEGLLMSDTFRAIRDYTRIPMATKTLAMISEHTNEHAVDTMRSASAFSSITSVLANSRGTDYPMVRTEEDGGYHLIDIIGVDS